MASTEWTEDRIAVLKQLWPDPRWSASRIAAEMGGITRNAVIGKAHRLGLTKPRENRPEVAVRATSPRASRPAAVRTQERTAASRKQIPPPPVAVAVPVLAPGEIPQGSHASVLSLTDHTCKWPIGDPARAGFHFCGKKSMTGVPYCPDHQRRAYQSPEAAESLRPRPGQRDRSLKA